MTELVKCTADELVRMSTDAIKAELAKVLEITADNLAYMAQLWKELNARGEDLSALQGGMMGYIQLIAIKKLDAQLVVAYAGRKTLLNYLARLPLSEQQKIAKNGKVHVVVEKDGDYVNKSVDLTNIEYEQITQIFDINAKDGFRSELKQIEMLEARSAPHRLRKRRLTKVEIDKKSGTMFVGGKHVMLESVIEAIEKAYNIKIDIE